MIKYLWNFQGFPWNYLAQGMDIFFLSYNECNCEENWQRLSRLHPRALRLHGITGIDRAHLTANALSATPWFWTIDGDNWLLEPLDHDASGESADLIMFHARDPLTGSWTKLGGAKLWRRNSMLGADMSQGDFCLNATRDKTTAQAAPTETRYNASAWDAWKTSFRHSVKLLSPIIQGRPQSQDRERYLAHWQACLDLDDGRNNAVWCWRGLQDAEEFRRQHRDLNLINDYTWLENHYHQLYTTDK